MYENPCLSLTKEQYVHIDQLIDALRKRIAAINTSVTNTQQKIINHELVPAPRMPRPATAAPLSASRLVNPLKLCICPRSFRCAMFRFPPLVSLPKQGQYTQRTRDTENRNAEACH